MARRRIDFEKFCLHYSVNGKTTNVPVKYNHGYYTLLRSQRQLPRGDEFEWKDSNEKPRLIKRLRAKIRRLREAREGSRPSAQRALDELWERATDVSQPWLYRQMILSTEPSGAEVVEALES